MKRLASLSLAFGMFAALGLAGCGEETSTKTTTENSTPGGKTVTEDKTTVKSTGDNPPPAATGEAPVKKE